MAAVMAIGGVVACGGSVAALRRTALRGTFLRAAFRRTLLCAALRGMLPCTALRGTLMLAAARESCLALRTEAAPVSCQARLGTPDIRYRVTAEPEGVMSARIADRLGRRLAQRHGAGQQPERHDCCEPGVSGLNIFHLARSLCDPPHLTTFPPRAGELKRLYSPKMRLSLRGHYLRSPACGAGLAGSGGVLRRRFFCLCGGRTDRLHSRPGSHRPCSPRKRGRAGGHAERRLS